MKRIAGAAAALLVAALSACSGSSASPELEVTQTPSAAPTTRTPTTGTSGPGSTGGLDVRYLDDDGTVKTVKVPSFPR